MKLSKFKYNLPDELISLHPSKNRDESRLLVLNRQTGDIEHKIFKDVIDYFNDKDVMVFNNSTISAFSTIQRFNKYKDSSHGFRKKKQS